MTQQYTQTFLRDLDSNWRVRGVEATVTSHLGILHKSFSFWLLVDLYTQSE